MVSKEALTVDAKRTRAEVAVVKETILIYFFFDLIINKIKLKFRFYVKLKDENTSRQILQNRRGTTHVEYNRRIFCFRHYFLLNLLLVRSIASH